MSNLDDFLKSVQVLKEGMVQYQTGQAVQDASKQLADLNRALLDDQQKLEAQSQIQNELAMRLGASGADASKIQSLTQNIAPSASAQFQAKENQELQTSSQDFQKGQQGREFKHQERLQKMKLDAAGLGGDQKLSKFVVGQADKFYKREQKNIEAIDTLASMKDLVAKGDTARIGIELGKTALLKSVGEDRITNEDIERGDNDPSFREKIARRLNLEIGAGELKDKQKFYGKLMEKLQSDAVKRLDAKVSGEATALSELYPEIDGQKFAGALRSKIPTLGAGDKQAAAAAKQEKIAKLEAWLADPVSKQPEFASKRQKAMEVIHKLKAQ